MEMLRFLLDMPHLGGKFQAASWRFNICVHPPCQRPSRQVAAGLWISVENTRISGFCP
jgi:hypothetical protein